MKTVYIVKGNYTVMGVFEEEDSAEEFSSNIHGSYVERHCVFKDTDEMKQVNDAIRSVALSRNNFILDTH